MTVTVEANEFREVMYSLPVMLEQCPPGYVVDESIVYAPLRQEINELNFKHSLIEATGLVMIRIIMRVKNLF